LWTQIEVVELTNDGSGLGFGISGNKSTGVVVKAIVPGSIADKVYKLSDLVILYFHIIIGFLCFQLFF
jgi:hypothetical protein